MTITEAHRLFRLLMDKGDALNYPNFRPEEIDVIFNLAQNRVVKQRYGKTNTKRLSFEEEQKRTDDLRNLVVEIQTDIDPGSRPVRKNNYNVDSIAIQIPSNYWFMVYERAVLNCTGCNQAITTVKDVIIGGTLTETIQGTYADVIPVTHLELNNVLKDPFRKPNNNEVLRLEFSETQVSVVAFQFVYTQVDSIELILPEGCTGLKYILRYIKKPTAVSLSGNTTFDLPDHMHEEVVSEAVKIALEGIEAKRTGTYVPLIDNTKE